MGVGWGEGGKHTNQGSIDWRISTQINDQSIKGQANQGPIDGGPSTQIKVQSIGGQALKSMTNQSL